MLATSLQQTSLVPTAASGSHLALLLLYVGLALIVSFTCSILEAALLSVRGADLEDRKARGSKGAARLLVLKRERLDDTISSILILNTLAHTFGVAGAGIQAQHVWPEGSWMLTAFPIVLTLLILVLTEIIPKTIGAVYASHMVGPVAITAGALVWSMRPVLFLTNFITRLFAKHEETKISRGELAAMVAMAARSGTLEQPDSRLVSNVLRYHDILVQDVMTPRTVVAMMPASATVADLLVDTQARPFSRIPIYEGNRDEVVGYVLQRQVLGALARGRAGRDTKLASFSRRALFLPETTPANAALRQLIEGQEHMALTADEYGGISGLLTLEDLMETILGVEILDESDRVADLRAEAGRLRQRRLELMSRGRRAEIDTDLHRLPSPAADENAADAAENAADAADDKAADDDAPDRETADDTADTPDDPADTPDDPADTPDPRADDAP